MLSNGVRIGFGVLLLAATAAFSLPLASGVWDPSWLRVAEQIEVVSGPPEAEVGQAPAPFEVVQQTPQGTVRWRVRGQRVKAATDLFVHRIASPDLWVREGTVTATVRAERGRVHLPKGGSQTRLELEGDVVVVATRDAADGGGEATLRSDRLTLFVDDGDEGRQVRLECPAAARVEADVPGQGRWTADAASLSAQLAPIAVTLAGPVALAGEPPNVGSVRATIDSLTVRGPTLAEGERLPAHLTVDADGVRLDELSLQGQRWSGDVPQIRARFEKAEAPTPAEAPTLALTHLRADGGDGLSLRQADGPGTLSARWLDWKAANASGRLTFAELSALAAGIEGGKRPAPWEVRAQRGELTLRREALGPTASQMRDALQAADLSGDVLVLRRGPPERERDRRRLKAERVQLTDGVLTASGRAQLIVGESELRSPRLRYRPDDGELLASDLLYRARFPQKGKDGAEAPPLVVEVRAPHGRATLSPDREAWKEHQRKRKALRRDGQRGFLLPEPLGALELWSEGRRRVQVRGDRGLVGEADRLTYAYEGMRAALSASEGRRARLAWEGGELTAQRIEVQRSEPEGPARAIHRLTARGGVVGSGLIPTQDASRPPKEEQAELRAEWLRAELRQTETKPPLEVARFEAGGEGGVTFGLSGEEGGRLEASGLKGDASRQDAEGRSLVDLELSGPWRAQLLLGRGPARLRGDGQLSLSLDRQRLEEAQWTGEGLPEASLRKTLRALSLRGGLELNSRELRVQADRADYDPAEGTYTLRGEPAVVGRGGVNQRANVHVLRLADE